MTVNSKLYPQQVLAVIENLQAIFHGGYADRIIERSLKSDPRRGAADRAFIAETTYEAVRWYRLLWEVRGAEPVDLPGWWELI